MPLCVCVYVCVRACVCVPLSVCVSQSSSSLPSLGDTGQAHFIVKITNLVTYSQQVYNMLIIQ